MESSVTRWTVAIALTAIFTLGGCGNRDLNASIEAMNEGVLLAQNDQYTQAESALEKATTLSNENHRAWYNLGQVRVKQKKWE
jgi:Flp pilus assembly protein TadD